MLTLFHVLQILIVELTYVTSFNTYTSNNTHWESSTPFIPSKNTSYGKIVLHHALEMEFNFIYYGKTSVSTHENVFRIGYGGPNICNNAGTRYPAMWIHPNSDQVQITISNSDSCWNNLSPWIAIEKYHKYHIVIKFNQTWQYASLTNATGASYIFIIPPRPSPTLNTVLYTLMNIWFSSEHDPSANITLSNITIKTWDPITLQPTNNPSLLPTISPTYNPTVSTIAPTDIPTVTPTKNPTNIPTTSTPSISPSISPSIQPTITPTYTPTERQINAREPSNSPLQEAHIPETTTFITSNIIIKNTEDYFKDEPSHWSDVFKNNVEFTLIVPITIGFILLICLIILWCVRRYKLKIDKSVSPSLNEEDIIFGKIYDKQSQLNMETQKQKEKEKNNNIDVLLPDDEDTFESLSSNAAEQLYIPQTHPSTITTPPLPIPIINEKSDNFNISLQDSNNNNNNNNNNHTRSNSNIYDLDSSIKHKKSFSFNNSKIRKKRSYSHQISQSHSIYSRELELQHQVTLAISNNPQQNEYIIKDGEGYKNNNNNNNNTLNINVHRHMQDEHGSDSEEDDDIDIYNGDVAPPSSGTKYNNNNYNKRNNCNQLIIASHSATPEMELYGKGKNKISNGADFNIDNDDIKSNDSLYMKPNKNYLQTPTKRRRDDNVISELYDKPDYMDRENTEGSDDYEWIQQSLQICDPIDWGKYLNNFKKNKVSDFRLNQLNENDWSQLIPTIGPRNYFKQLWFQYEKQTTKSMHL